MTSEKEAPLWQQRARLYVDGILPASGKKIAWYAFRDSLKHFSANLDDKTFDLYVVVDELPEGHLEDFLEVFGESGRWRIIPVDAKPTSSGQ